jgi:hypothetical protein
MLPWSLQQRQLDRNCLPHLPAWPIPRRRRCPLPTRPQVFRTPKDVADATQDAVSLLRVPRSALGITASSKGLVAGRLAIFDQRAGGRRRVPAGAGRH